jgi:hypothetical protein
MWRVLPLWLLACGYEHGRLGVDAAPPPPPPDAAVDAPPPPANFHLRIEGWIDGRSTVVIAGHTLRWHHIEHAAPGREQFVNMPTKLDTLSWYPTWPDVPDAENRDCNCDSSIYSDLPLGIPRAPATASLTIIQARKTPSIVQAPSEVNNYTLIVELVDTGSGAGGSAWHILDIDVVVD